MKVFSLYHSISRFQSKKPNPKQDAPDTSVSFLGSVKFAGLRFEINDLTHLKRAIELEDMEQLQHLLEKGIYPDVSDDSKETPLIFAAKWNRIKSVQALLDKGANPNRQNLAGETALFWAAYNGDQEIAQVLLAHGADPNLPNYLKETPLSSAALRGRTEIIQALLDKGADPNLPDRDGKTPLSLAAHNGRTASVTALLTQGTNINLPDNLGRTPLSLASQLGHTESVQALLTQGADPNLPDKEGKTPLSVASQLGHTKSVQALLTQGADPNLPDKEGKTPLSFAAQLGHTESVQTLLTQGAGPNLPDNMGRTPISLAAYNGHAESVQVLLDKGADFNLPDNMGRTPLLLAAYNGHAKSVQALLVKGADPNLPDKLGKTPLSLAAQLGHTESVQALLDKGADPNLPDKEGKTPLSLAVQQGYTEVVQGLLIQGANPGILTPSLQLLIYIHDPTAFLNHMILHQHNLLPQDISDLFANLGFRYPLTLGKKLLPELLALLPIYARKVDGNGENLGIASRAITRLYNYVYVNSADEGFKIRTVLGSAFQNWGRIGMLGLSFSRWKYDSMGMWKGTGPTEKPPLLVQSGLFKPVPARPDDDTYFRSFVHYDPASGLSIELRRAYIVVSKPGLGSVVIRNSSHHFGRDLFPEPAYYHPEKVYTQGSDVLNPEEIVSGNGGYMNVLGKTLNRTNESQTLHHGKIQTLLDDFQGVMERYTQWKCGFKDGNAPAGFGMLLEAALNSAAKDGVMSPFGKEKNLRLAPRLAWINPYELPAPVASLDLSQPEILQEAVLYLKILKGQVVVRSEVEYAEKMPKLTAFLAEGLRQGLELVLTA